MKAKSIFIFLFTIFSAFGQKEKPLNYYDLNGIEISKNDFEKKIFEINDEGKTYLNLVFENDTSLIATIVRRKNYGKLDSLTHSKLNNYLEVIEKVDKTKFTIIQYHPGKDNCNDGLLRFNGKENHCLGKKYIENLKNSHNLEAYYIHKLDANINFKKSGWINWYSDKNRFIETLFFKHHYPCGSFVAVDNKTRNYILFLGEYGASTVTKIIEEISKQS